MDIQKAQESVVKLADGSVKTELQNRLDAITSWEENIARRDVRFAEAWRGKYIKKAQDSVNKLPNESVKTDLQARLDAIVTSEDLESGEIKATGWVQVERHWYYFDENSKKQSGWVKVYNTWYYMNENGIMQTGLTQVGNTWYYKTSSGVIKTGWTRVGSTWYYMTSSGEMQTGGMRHGNKTYYMNSSGVMQTGKVNIDGERWHPYYFSANGVLDLERGARKPDKNSGLIIFNIPIKDQSFIPSGAILISKEYFEHVYVFEKNLGGGAK